MTESILIKDGLLIDPSEQKEFVADIRIADGKISEVGKNLSAQKSERIIDADGLWITPGFVDLHTHLRDMGQKDSEDIKSGSQAAAAGGFTTVLTMANTEPVMDNAATLSLYLQKIKEHAVIEVLPVAAVTKGLQGIELTNMNDLAQLGAVAFSDDGMPIQNMAVLRRALEYIRLTGKLIISHSEDKDLSESGVINEGEISTRMGLPGLSWASETVAVARELEIVRLTKAPYHFTHLSCAGSVELVRRAKKDGLAVTADVTPHHLSLSVNDLGGYRTCCKMKPPLRTQEDIAALITGIKDGTIDAIATDHAPHSDLAKAQSMAQAPFGIIGLETAFALTYDVLVKKSGMSKLAFFNLLTTAPSRIIDLPIPSIKAGARANLTVIDPDFQWNYDAQNGASRAHNSPFCGTSLHTKVITTICHGKVVFEAVSQPRKQKNRQ